MIIRYAVKKHGEAGIAVRVLLLLCLLFSFGCGDRKSSAENLNEFIGAPARVVWVRQVEGEGNDPFCDSESLILMGLDGRAGNVERQILPETGNYRKPLLTPDGSGIIFTRYTEPAVYFVNWDGSGLRKLADGSAAHVWHEAETGIDWVYYNTGPMVGENFAGVRLKRFQLKDPSIQETVWDKTPSCLDNIHLSDDGTQMIGLFPWPMVGVVDIPSQTLRKVGEGCWTSFSPDNRYLFWIFDGAHKNLLMRTLDGSINHKVRINTSVGSRRAEVYHPRWSNHARYMTLTGPFLQMGEYNNITGGGIGINAYVGRFNSEYTDVEEWYQLTDHPHADFFPDLWVDDTGSVQSAEPAAERVEQSAGQVQWPVHKDGLVYLWDNSKSANGIDDPDQGYYRCSAVRKDRARFTRLNEMYTRKGCFLAEGSQALQVGDHAGGSEFSFMLNVRAEAKQPSETGVILSKGKAMLIQHSSELYWVYGDSAYVLTDVIPEENSHIAISFVPGNGFQFYMNGSLTQLKADEPPVEIKGNQSLVFGGMPDGSADWAGAIDGIAWYKRVLSPEEMDAEYKAYRATRPAHRNDTVPQLVANARLVEISPMPTAAGIAPYRSALVEYLYEIENVIEGTADNDQIIVQHWAILDAVSYPLNREVGKQYRLQLEALEDHPELEGERISSELIEPVDIYLDVATE